jgi:hypothetical protein
MVALQDNAISICNAEFLKQIATYQLSSHPAVFMKLHPFYDPIHLEGNGGYRICGDKH